MKKDTAPQRKLLSAHCGFVARNFLLTAAALHFIGLGVLGAQETPLSKNDTSAESDSGDAKKLDPIVVVASPIPQHLSEVSPSVSFIAASALLPAGNYTVADALRETNGVSVASYGATGALASVYTRGADSRMTQLTLDGRKLNGGFSNFDVSSLQLDNVSNLQFLRGATSTLHGANAMAGVLELQSVNALEQEKPQASFSGEGGSYGFWRSGFQLNGTAENTGIFSEKNDTGLGVSLGGSWVETDNKRGNNHYRIATILPRFDYKVSEQVAFNLVARYSDYTMGLPGDNTVPGGFNPFSKQDGSNLLISPGVKILANDTVEFQAFYSYTRNALDNITSDWQSWLPTPAWSTPFASTATVDAHEINLRSTWQIIDAVALSGGFSFEEKTFKRPADFNYTFADYNEHLTSVSPWLQTQITPVENLKITLGGRFQQFSDYENAWTGEAQIAYKIAATNSTIHARIANAYATPDAGTLAFGYSSVGLKPEKNTAVEFGLKQQIEVLNGASIGVIFFDNSFHDMVQWDFMNSTGININKATTRGVELNGTADLSENLRIFASTNFLKAENKQSGARLARRPDFTATAGVEMTPIAPLKIGLSATYVHGVEDIDAAFFTPVKNKNYTYVRAFTTWKFSENFEVFGRVENLLNQKYWTANGYPALPINAYAGVRITF